MKVEQRKVFDLKFYPGNPRQMSEDVLDDLKKSIKEFGFVDPLIINEENEVIGGNQRLKAAIEEGLEEVPVTIIKLPKDKEKALNLALNKIQGRFDNALLFEFIKDLSVDMVDLSGFSEQEIYLLNWSSRFVKSLTGNLSRDFVYPPFSVLDARGKQWREIKRKWQGQYGDELVETKDFLLSRGSCMMTAINKGTSRFDPALAQIIYKWFMPDGNGKILNPTCGEPCTGIVAGALGYSYLGIDIRQEQIDINEKIVKKHHLDDKVKYFRYNSVKLNEANLLRDFDMVFYSPPYYGIEIYSFDSDDISVKGIKQGYENFMDGYCKIMKNSAELLKNNRFFIMKLGDVREPKGKDKGTLYNFLGDTISYGNQIGLRFYNDLVLVSPVGTASYRARNLFSARKIVRTHQRVLIFYKGDNFSDIKKDFSFNYSEKELVEKFKKNEDIES